MSAIDCKVFVCATISMPIFAAKLRKIASTHGVDCPITPVRAGASATLGGVGGAVLIEGTDRFVASRSIISRNNAVVVFDTPIVAHELSADIIPVDYDMGYGDAWSMSKASPGHVSKTLGRVISYVRDNRRTMGTYSAVDRSSTSRLLMVINMAAEGSGNLVKALSAITHSLQPAEREVVRAALRTYLSGSAVDGRAAIADIAKISGNKAVDDSVKQMTDVLLAEGDKYRIIVSPKTSPTNKKRAAKALGLSTFEIKFLENLLKTK